MFSFRMMDVVLKIVSVPEQEKGLFVYRLFA